MSMSTDEEIEELRALGREVAGAMQSPWEPACIERVFSPLAGGQEIVFTLQRWIDLSAVRSPFLLGEIPEKLDALEKAAEIFGLSIEGMEPQEAADVARVIRRCIGEAFAMRLEMRPRAMVREEGGFGEWLPIYTCLVTQCFIPRSEVAMMDVREAFALIATLRWNAGWSVAGEPYATREIEAGKQENRKGAE